ncbi:hypothetical protein CTAYLR_002753 [Chrysophaeum taylorii]|uniref:Uncharacterized protein n=1 Tax=Chrysophaeum taylorii TaxID=2483200 RepID=A0AAD7UDZ6_9STRA|nr:hypothetical protein CTAYLR_002753 [Chrysophaeum taylorii]
MVPFRGHCATASEMGVLVDCVAVMQGVASETFGRRLKVAVEGSSTPEVRWEVSVEARSCRWAHVSTGAMVGALETMARGASDVEELRSVVRRARETCGPDETSALMGAAAGEAAAELVSDVERLAVACGAQSVLGLELELRPALAEARFVSRCLACARTGAEFASRLADGLRAVALEGWPVGRRLLAAMRASTEPYLANVDATLRGEGSLAAEAPSFASQIAIASRAAATDGARDADCFDAVRAWRGLEATKDAFFVARGPEVAVVSPPPTPPPEKENENEKDTEATALLLAIDCEALTRREEELETLTRELEAEPKRAPAVRALPSELWALPRVFDHATRVATRRCESAIEARVLEFRGEFALLRRAHDALFGPREDDPDAIARLDDPALVEAWKGRASRQLAAFFSRADEVAAYERAFELTRAVERAASAGLVRPSGTTRLEVKRAAVAHVVRVVRFYVGTELRRAASELEAGLESATSLTEAVDHHRRYLFDDGLARATFANHAVAYLRDDVLAILDAARRFFADATDDHLFRQFRTTVAHLLHRLLDIRGLPPHLAAFLNLLDWDRAYFVLSSSSSSEECSDDEEKCPKRPRYHQDEGRQCDAKQQQDDGRWVDDEDVLGFLGPTEEDEEVEDAGLLEPDAEMPTDTEAALQRLRPSRRPHVVLWHLLYSVLEDRTAVDREVRELAAAGKVRLVQLPSGGDDVGVLTARDWRSEVEMLLPEDAALSFAAFSLDRGSELYVRDPPVSGDSLCAAGLLRPRRDTRAGHGTSWWFACPGYGALAKRLHHGRDVVLKALRRAKYRELNIDKLRSTSRRGKDKSALAALDDPRSDHYCEGGLDFFAHDLVGRSLAALDSRPAGRFLRLLVPR